VDKADPKPKLAIVPSKRKRGALADITVPNQTKEATEVDTDSSPKHSKRLTRQRQSGPSMIRNRIQLKSVRVDPPKPTKVVAVYKTRSTTKKNASRQITSRVVKDAVIVAPSRPARNSKLTTLRSTTGVKDPTDPDQEGETVQEEPTSKRKKSSQELAEGVPTGGASNLRLCSEVQIRAEDGEPDDLDKEDIADPCMEPEYQVECYQYMRELEVSGHYF
jgi:hypothetical protein